MAEIDDLDERIRELEVGFATEKSKVETERVWLAIVGTIIMIWLGLTSIFAIPQLVEDTAISDIEENLEKIRDEANLHIADIRSARRVAETFSPISWVEVENLTFEHEPDARETQLNYCHFDRDFVDAALGGWSDWDAHRVIVANPTTGEVSSGMVFRINKDESSRPAHARFGPTNLSGVVYPYFEHEDRRSNWNEASTCVLGFVVPAAYLEPISAAGSEGEEN